MTAAFLSDSERATTTPPLPKPSLKSGHMHSDPSVPSARSMTTTQSSGLFIQSSPSTGGGSDWCERFDTNQRCMNYIRKVVEDCLKGLINFGSGNMSWKIPPHRGRGNGEGTSKSS